VFTTLKIKFIISKFLKQNKCKCLTIRQKKTQHNGWEEKLTQSMELYFFSMKYKISPAIINGVAILTAGVITLNIVAIFLPD